MLEIIYGGANALYRTETEITKRGERRNSSKEEKEKNGASMRRLKLLYVCVFSIPSHRPSAPYSC